MRCETMRSFTDGHPEPPPISKAPPSPIWKWNLNMATVADGHPMTKRYLVTW